MALNPTALAAQLMAMTTEDKSQEALTMEFANIITNYIKTATVSSTGVGNMGAPVNSVGTIL